MFVYCLETVGVDSIENKMCKEMLKKLSKVTLFPLLNDLIVFQKFSDYAWLPTKTQGLFVSTMMPGIAHELAHAIEIPHKRLVLPDWGIKNDYNLAAWSNKRFMAAMAREIRVRAIESFIVDDKEANRKYDSKHARVFATEIWEAELETRIPFGKFYKREDFIEWGHFTYQNTRRVWNKDRVMSEWDARATIINDWIESDVESVPSQKMLTA